jgi:serine protease Do
MRSLRLLPLIAGMLLSLPIAVCQPGAARAETPSDSIAAVVAKVKPAVVTVISVQRPTKKPGKPGVADAAANTSEKPMIANGSGFLIDPSGFVATNKHVIDDAVSLFVVTADGIRYKARIVGLTSKADIALLKIDAPRPLPAVAFGDSDKMRVGDTVIAIGSPFGFDESVTAGIVSAVNRDISESPFDEYIQTDAPINHGNSGGPLFNLSGEVIGMNSVLFAPGTYSGSIGLGFAIPSDELNFVYKRLIATGQIRAGMLPIRTQPVTWMLARAISAPGLSGALVAAVQAGGDKMMRGQIKAGDIVLAFNGQAITDPRDLARKAAQAPIGSDAALEIFRDGQRSVVHVPIQAWPEGKQPQISDAGPQSLGLELAAGPRGGVLVASVDPTGSAASSGVQKGDIIVQIQARPVSDPGQALRMLKALSPDKHGYAAVLVERAGQRTWIPLAVPD